MKRVWKSILSFFGFKKNEKTNSVKSETTKKIKDAVDEHPYLFKDEPIDEPEKSTPLINADKVNDFGETYKSKEEKLPTFKEVKEQSTKIAKNNEVHTRSEFWNRHNFTHYISRNGASVEITLKEEFMLSYLAHINHKWVSPTALGRAYGMKVKNRKDYNAGHSRNCMQRLLKMKLVQVNDCGHYKLS